MREARIGARPWSLHVLGTGAALAVLLSAIELGAFFRAAGFHHALGDLAWPAALTAGVLFVAFVCTALGTGLLWRLGQKRWSHTPTAALAAFAACLFLGLGLSLRHAETLASLLARRTLLWSSLGVAVACALGAAWLWNRRREASAAILRLAMLLPLVLLGAALLTHAFQTGSGLRGTLGLLVLLCLATWTWRAKQGAQLPQWASLHLGLFLALCSTAWMLKPSDAPALGTPGVWSERPVRHVILISVDTLRPTSLSCYAGGVQTPAIDQFALDGIRFERAISPAPWTLPALSSIMTGMPPAVHGALGRNGLLPRSLPTLAELMAAEGYRSAAIGSNHLLTRGFSRGFHSSDFYPKRPLWESLGYRLFDNSRPATTETLTDLSIAWLEAHKQDPSFLWLHYFDPHSPYAPPAEFQPKGTPPPRIGRNVGPALFTALRNNLTPSPEERDWVKQLYDGEVRYVDANIARLIATLKELNMYDEALIILTSDHGEEFWEHESLGHGHNLFDESLRVPLLLKLPNSSARAVVEHTVSTQRLMSTILELCGIDSELAAQQPDSLVSTWSDVAAGASPEANLVLSSGMLYGEDKQAITGDRGKYILGQRSEREWFFNLKDDPGELYPIAPSGFSEAEALRAALGHFEAAAGVLRTLLGAKQEHVERVDTEALKALGYL